jgi:hypothetical protein
MQNIKNENQAEPRGAKYYDKKLKKPIPFTEVLKGGHADDRQRNANVNQCRDHQASNDSNWHIFFRMYHFLFTVTTYQKKTWNVA